MTMTTGRLRIVHGVFLAALSSLSAAHASPMVVKTVSAPHAVLARQQLNFPRAPGFFESYLAPGVSAALRGERVGITDDYASSWSNRSTQDLGAAGRVGTRAIRALRSGVKRYAIERLAAEGFTLPVLQGRGRRGTALSDDLRGPRLQLGVSSRAPRVDLLIPVNAGRVVVSADGRLRLTTTFDSVAFGFRIVAKIDVPMRTAVIGFNLGF